METRLIRDLPQVAEVMPVKLVMTSCGQATDMIAMHGVDKQLFSKFRDYVVAPAALQRFRTHRDGVLVGNRIAARYGWKQGEHVTLKELGNISFVVDGLFTTNGTADDFLILAGRRFLQEAKDQQGISNHVLVRLKPGAQADAVCRAIDLLPLTVQTTTQPEKVHLLAALDQLADLVSVSKIVIGIIVVVILIAMGNAVAMTARERAHEFAVLRTLGFPKAEIMLLVLGESMIQTLLGGLVGCALVVLLMRTGIIKNVSTCGFTVNFIAGPFAWICGISAIVLAGILGSMLPAITASRLDIVAALRRED